MASGTRLDLTFRNSSGDKVMYKYNYINPEVATADVQALMEGMITNGSIFENAPTVIEDATLVVTRETSLNVVNA